MVIDILLVALVVGAVILETKRGFGKALFDFIALLITVRVVSLFSPQLAKSIQLLSETQANQTLWYAGMFVVVGVLFLFIGKLVYDSTLITLDSFDPFLGGVLGAGIAVILGHAIMKALAIAASIGGAHPEILANSPIGMEFYGFVTYHKIIVFLSSLTS